MATLTFTGTDSYTLSDVVPPVFVGVSKSTSDTLSLSDIISAAPLGFSAQIVSDTITFSDVSVFFSGITTVISDSLSFSDSIRTGSALVDFLNLIDSVILGFGIPNRTSLSNLILSDSVLTTLSIFGSTFDVNTLSDLINYTLPQKSPNDTNILSDGVTLNLASIFVDISYSISDSVQFFDSRQASGFGIQPKLGDSFSLLDAVYPLLNSVESNYLRNYLNDSI